MKYLGVDFGLKRIGLAISEGELATPWQLVEVKSFADAVEKVAKLSQEQGFTKIVVGLPEGKMGQNVIGFVKALMKHGIKVETVDETLSSQKAKRSMVLQGIPQKKRRFEDAYSAAEILQEFLDSL